MRALERIGRLATSTPVRVVVTVGLLAVIAATIDWTTVVDGLDQASWGLFALAVVLLFASFIVAAYRWRKLLEAADVPATGGQAFNAYLIGMFANNLLPTGFGGDAVRAWVVAGKGKPLARGLTSVGIDRASALACLLVLAWVAVGLKAGDIPGDVVFLLGASTAIGIAAAGAAVAVARRRGLGRFLPESIRPWTGEVAKVIRSTISDRTLIGEIVLIGVGYQAIVLAAFWLISESLGLALDPADLAVVVPTVLIVMLVPISLAGFGVREGAFIVLLAEFGIPAADATLLSLLSVVAVTIASLPAVVPLATGRSLAGGPDRSGFGSYGSRSRGMGPMAPEPEAGGSRLESLDG